MVKTDDFAPKSIAHCQPSAPATPQMIEGRKPETVFT